MIYFVKKLYINSLYCHTKTTIIVSNMGYSCTSKDCIEIYNVAFGGKNMVK